MLSMSWPVAILIGAAQILLGIVDGIRDLRATYHPIRDARTYLESRKAS